jgi:hypothetical protein
VSKLLARIASAEKRNSTDLRALEHSNDVILNAKTLESSRVAKIDFFGAIAPTLKPKSQVIDSLVIHLARQGCKSEDARYGFRVRAGLDESINEAAFLDAVAQHKCEG